MKRIISAVLAICLIFGICAFAGAAPANQAYAEKLQQLGLFQGTNAGFDLDKPLTRTQGVVMIVRLLGVEGSLSAKEYKHPFTDLKGYPWADSYVGYAYENGITKGASETVFGYSKPMTEAMFLTMVLRVLNYADKDDGTGDFVWSAPFALAQKVGLTDANRPESFLRDDMVKVCWNALNASVKGESETLASVLAKDGALDISKFRTLGGKTENQTTANTSASAADSGSSDSVRRRVAVESVTMTNESVSVKIGGKYPLNCMIMPENASDKTLTWTSSDPTVATVEAGVVTGVSIGTAVITATAASGCSGSCSVMVYQASNLKDNELPRIPLT